MLGPFTLGFFVVFQSLIFLSILNKRIKLLIKNKYFIFLGTWSIYFIFSSLISQNILNSLESSLFYFRFGFFSLAIWHAIDMNKNFFFYLFTSLLFTYTFLIIDGYYQFFNGVNLFGNVYNNIRLTGPFGNHYVLGSFLVRFYPILVGLFVLTYQKNHFILFILFLYLVLIDVLIYISGERTAFFYLIFSTILIIIFVKRWLVLRLFSFIISIIIISIITFSSDNVKNRMIDATISQMNLNPKQTEEKREIVIFTPDHTTFYKTSYEILKKNIFFGIGPKMYREECKKAYLKKFNSCSSHPHNTYMQLLAETGIVGFLVIFSLFTYTSYFFVSLLINKIFSLNLINYKVNDSLILMVISFYITLWPFVPTGNFFNNWLSVVYFFPIGFILQQFYLLNKNE